MTARLQTTAAAVACAAVVVFHCATGRAAEPAPDSPEQQAIAFLSAEVAKWEPENHCYSCHNNGDAVRALMFAIVEGQLDDRQPLEPTLRFLAAPESWDANGPDGPFKDLKLARIQFGAALAQATSSGILKDRTKFAKGAALVAELQQPGGNWQTDVPGTVGSPVTYGTALATALAQQTLRNTDSREYDDAIVAAERWFERTEAKTVLDAAGTLLGLASDGGDAAGARRRQCLDVIRAGRSDDGGWGPFINAPPDVFDTAVVTMALSMVRSGVHLDKAERTQLADMIAGGRQFLIAAQEDDGGWPPTTRPPGVDSYAQRISTSGWALQALLATRPK